MTLGSLSMPWQVDTAINIFLSPSTSTDAWGFVVQTLLIPLHVLPVDIVNFGQGLIKQSLAYVQKDIYFDIVPANLLAHVSLLTKLSIISARRYLQINQLLCTRLICIHNILAGAWTLTPSGRHQMRHSELLNGTNDTGNQDLKSLSAFESGACFMGAKCLICYCRWSAGCARWVLLNDGL